jgi:hypothetical protein
VGIALLAGVGATAHAGRRTLMSQLGLEATQGKPSIAVVLHQNGEAPWSLKSKIVVSGSGPGVKRFTEHMVALAKKDNLGWKVRPARFHSTNRVDIRIHTKTRFSASEIRKAAEEAAARINEEDLASSNSSSPSNGR